MIAIEAREIRQRAAAVNELRQGQREISFLQTLLAKLIGGGSLTAVDLDVEREAIQLPCDGHQEPGGGEG